MFSYCGCYQEGFHYEVYSELLVQERVFEEPIYVYALAVGRAMMMEQVGFNSLTSAD
jgi:hypothetical protein